MKKQDNRQRLFEIMKRVDPSFKPKLNENAPFNDNGEPTMTHQQYRDDSEFDNDFEPQKNDFEPQQTEKSIINDIEKHFNTLIEKNGSNYSFLTKDIGGLEFEIHNNVVNASAFVNGQVKKFPETNIQDLNIEELINFFEPYIQYILTGSDAEKRMDIIYQQNANDSRYSNQERSMFGGY